VSLELSTQLALNAADEHLAASGIRDVQDKLQPTRVTLSFWHTVCAVDGCTTTILVYVAQCATSCELKQTLCIIIRARATVQDGYCVGHVVLLCVVLDLGPKGHGAK
jgi:hypothetical protein